MALEFEIPSSLGGLMLKNPEFWNIGTVLVYWDASGSFEVGNILFAADCPNILVVLAVTPSPPDEEDNRFAGFAIDLLFPNKVKPLELALLLKLIPKPDRGVVDC